ncbi:MAG: DNRLRE domain-containing protein [Phycisphaerales bacterium]
MRQSAVTAATVAFAAAAIALGARADQVVLTSVADNTLIEDPTGAYSCGAAQYFFAGKVGVNGGSTLRRGALRFNVSSIPAGSTITSVSLRMYCSAAGLTGNYPVALKRFLKSWGEGPSVAFGGGGADSAANDVTWLHRFYSNTLWTTPGGEFVSTASASRSVGNVGYYTWATTAGLVADVQLWVNDPSSNHGWCVQGNETTLQSVKRFDSRESGSSAARPQLTVVFTPPSNPADLTGDGRVDAADLSVLLNAWGTTGPGDLNASGLVDAADLTALLAAWTG